MWNKMETSMIQKHINQSLELITELRNSNSCSVEGISFMENRDINVVKEKNDFIFSFYSPCQEYQIINPIKSNYLNEFKIIKDNKTYIVPKSLITSYKDLWNETNGFSCKVSSQCLYSENINLQESYYFRSVFPLKEDTIRLDDINCFGCKYHFNNKNCWTVDLIKVIVNNNEFHFWKLKLDAESSLIIDSTIPCSFDLADKIPLSILVSFGFLFGTIYLDETYIILSKEKDFTNPTGIYYKSLRETIKGQYSIFTTNAYSVLVPIGKNEDNQNGEQQAIQKIEDESWTNKLLRFDKFSELVQEIYDNDSVLRSAMTIIEASKFALDIQLAAYCVAFETLTKYIVKQYGLKPPMMLDKCIWKKIKTQFLKSLSEIKSIALTKEQNDFIKRKIENLNQPTNKDTLIQPFAKLGYTLSDEEIKCIGYRNRSLHGNLPIEKNEDEIDKLFYVNLMFHKLCSIIILKTIGFEGYIINNIKLHAKNIKRIFNEDGFIKI
jgi:hypothetical protein